MIMVSASRDPYGLPGVHLAGPKGEADVIFSDQTRLGTLVFVVVNDVAPDQGETTFFDWVNDRREALLSAIDACKHGHAACSVFEGKL